MKCGICKKKKQLNFLGICKQCNEWFVNIADWYFGASNQPK